jgi:uncharacterized protein (TIGR03086 family)
MTTEGWEGFRRALDGCEDVVRGVPGERWESPSPCVGWTARDVMGHVVGGLRWAAALIRSEPGPLPALPGSIEGEDPVAAWESARRNLERACTPSALARRVQWPFGEQTVNVGLGIFSLEILIHTWDIARAAGLAVSLDPELVHEHLNRVRPRGDRLRGPGMYGPEQPAPAGAGEQDQLLAFLGRRV